MNLLKLNPTIEEVAQYVEDMQLECAESGEHFKLIFSENGNDVCLNCGGVEQ